MVFDDIRRIKFDERPTTAEIEGAVPKNVNQRLPKNVPDIPKALQGADEIYNASLIR